MRVIPRTLAKAFTVMGAISLCTAAHPPAGAGDEIDAVSRLSREQAADHVLNRLAFGPRPGQVRQVLDMGWEQWARAQLRPDRIDDSRVERHVAQQWPAMNMTMTQVRRRYQPPYPMHGTPQERLEFSKKRNRLLREVRHQLTESVIYRAAHSQRQFQEVIVTFWRNHFNVDQNKDDVGYYANHFEQTLREHAFGRFDRLLLATAQHPAMLMYLDNDVSQKPLSDSQMRLVERYESRDRKPRSVVALARHRGLNENYARELMELHTLGVDNYYTQVDVVALSRALTGWTAGKSDGSPFGKPGGEYGFVFRQGVHDRDAKVVLGRRLPGNKDVLEGIGMVRRLAHHPGTARFISYKLCRYLVRDEPSPELVRAVAKVFERSRGDLTEVYEAIIFSDEFLSQQNYRVKFKTPFEFVIASLRATDAQITKYGDIRGSLDRMGYDVYGCVDPTGYYDRAEAWLDPGVLVYRWDFALRLADGSVKGVRIPDAFTQSLEGLAGEDLRVALFERFLPGGVDPASSDLLAQQLSEADSVNLAVGLVLGSPVFQQQ